MPIGADAVSPSVEKPHPEPGKCGKDEGEQVPWTQARMDPTQQVEEHPSAVKEQEKNVEEAEHQGMRKKIRDPCFFITLRNKERDL